MRVTCHGDRSGAVNVGLPFGFSGAPHKILRLENSRHFPAKGVLVVLRLDPDTTTPFMFGRGKSSNSESVGIEPEMPTVSDKSLRCG
jgi:hypothetical protein